MNDDRPTGSGRGVAVAIILIALAAASFAWWFQWNRGHLSLEFWGPEAAELIRTGKRVTLCEFDGNSVGNSVGNSDADETSDWPLPVIRQIDISRAPGLVHARQALIEDNSFADDGLKTTKKPAWAYGLQFAKGGRSVSVLLDLTNGYIRRADDPQTKSLLIRDGLKMFVDEQLEAIPESPR